MDEQQGAPDAWRFCVAPMMDWTDRHCRYFMRLLSRHARLYTEMIHCAAILRGNTRRLLRFDASEHPLALQLGGSDPDDLARAAELGVRRFGYDEVNLNCGCPSERVSEGNFGACLMGSPDLVRECIEAMRGAVDVPVTVKTRIGIDDSEEYTFFKRFVETVAEGGCETFVVHARKAWLKGLSCKENREVPPLVYEHVYRIKQDLPQLRIVINGGINSLAEAREHLRHVDGVMLGRQAYENPYMLTAVDAELFGSSAPALTRAEAIDRMLPYLERELAAGTPLREMTQHLLGLYRGEDGARAFRRTLAESSPQSRGLETLEAAMWEVEPSWSLPCAA